VILADVECVFRIYASGEFHRANIIKISEIKK